MIKLIKANSIEQLEVNINKFIQALPPEDYVSNVQMCCSPSIYGNEFVAMLFVVHRED